MVKEVSGTKITAQYDDDYPLEDFNISYSDFFTATQFFTGFIIFVIEENSKLLMKDSQAKNRALISNLNTRMLILLSRN